MKKRRKWVKVVGGFVSAVIVLIIGLASYLTITEYKPADVEELDIVGEVGKKVSLSEEITLVTYNIGYGCNGEEADFFMDGGKMVRAKSKENVKKNLDGVIVTLDELDADVVFLQEIDLNSKRAYGINEVEKVTDYFLKEKNYSFAYNYYCKYVPYPFPETIGKVESGIMTLNEFMVTDAKRYNLPCSYDWPIRLGQLKRGLLVERVPIEGSDKEVVFVNLHLEAYANGEKKRVQTEVLVELLQSEYAKGNYVIAGGDFNQNFPGFNTEEVYPLKDIEYFEPEMMNKEMLPEDWSWVVDLSTPTCRLLNESYNKESENTQYYVIDGYILSPNVVVEEIKTIDVGFAYSDHNPVYLRVRLK